MKLKSLALLFLLMTGLVGNALLAPLAAEPFPARGARPLVDRDLAPALIDLLRHAERDIALMQYQTRYYEEYAGSASNRLLHELIAAADRGVKVRLITDVSDWKEERTAEGETSENEKNRVFARYLVAHGAEVWEDPGEVLSHQKVIVVDGKVTVICSHNWSFYSTDKNSEASVMIWSEELAGGMLGLWDEMRAPSRPFTEKNEAAPPDYDPAAMTAPDVTLDAWLTSLEWMPVESVEIAANRDYATKVGALIRAAERHVEIVQNTIEYLNEVPPYARPDRPKDLPPSIVNTLVHDLADLAQRGVGVDVVIDWSEQRDNSRSIQAASLLRRGGATVFYDDPKVTLHTKMLVVDGLYSVIGSTNWTFNAFEQGNEVSVIVRSEPLAARFDAYFETLRASGRNSGNGSLVPPITETY